MHVHTHTHELTLGFSFFLGVIHALEPGHGKTAMFVYLADGRRSIWHPVVMGLSTAVSHSVSLFAIAFSVHLAHHVLTGDHAHEDTISSFFQWISALLVVAVGLWMLRLSLRGRHGCCANHGHDHTACCGEKRSLHTQEQAVGSADFASGKSRSSSIEPLAAAVSGSPLLPVLDVVPESKVMREQKTGSLRITALLGLAVGLLPCPTALAACFSGLSEGMSATVYLIIALFAAGIAFSLAGVGILLQYFGKTASVHSSRFKGLPWPLIRSVLILMVGIVSVIRLI